MEIIKRGAEAILYLDYFEGRKVLVKERIKKPYRIEEIDIELRKERTRREVKLLTEARKIGVPTPQVFFVDEENAKIVMEFIDGKKVKDVVDFLSKEDLIKIFQQIGESIGKLHSFDIIHGDLTTSNMIIKEDLVYFIDFGLGFFSKRIEDKGVDLNLLREAVRATHYPFLNLIWENIVIGYKKNFKDWEKVIKKVDEIEKRGRYTEK
ncbi:MAG: KEOPS complex kinase/ATPase Bud32 [Candidatus Aenigmarchaeota archaeon]|nr:KEOPS complex kinase/ATPase Bud32 [Candidatus Aenigmarchaeota archaeon]MCX8191003.1 KEOPS complex kinase/ATPase Bud32 [Candidatus Aenigmarchaeota archaeon]MDW8160274.1 KEOPS complex kinase/ATPase Bud32 [Candidatus Aenigmarchaeota archaeon]